MQSVGGGKRKTACVTGGSGYIASVLIKTLLEKGYAVKTTVRDPGSVLAFFPSFPLLLVCPGWILWLIQSAKHTSAKSRAYIG
jgi:hypothetical protein